MSYVQTGKQPLSLQSSGLSEASLETWCVGSGLCSSSVHCSFLLPPAPLNLPFKKAPCVSGAWRLFPEQGTPVAGWQEYDRFLCQKCTAGDVLTSYAVGFCCVCLSLCFAVQKPLVFQGFLLAVGLHLWASAALSWKPLLLPAPEPLLLPLTASERQILQSSLWSIWSWFL